MDFAAVSGNDLSALTTTSYGNAATVEYNWMPYVKRAPFYQNFLVKSRSGVMRGTSFVCLLDWKSTFSFEKLKCSNCFFVVKMCVRGWYGTFQHDTLMETLWIVLWFVGTNTSNSLVQDATSKRIVIGSGLILHGLNGLIVIWVKYVGVVLESQCSAIFTGQKIKDVPIQPYPIHNRRHAKSSHTRHIQREHLVGNRQQDNFCDITCDFFSVSS